MKRESAAAFLLLLALLMGMLTTAATSGCDSPAEAAEVTVDNDTAGRADAPTAVED